MSSSHGEAPSIGVGRDDLADAPATQGGPGREADRGLGETDRAVTHERVRPAGVEGIHLVGVADGAVRRVDDLRVLPDRRPAVGPDVTPGVVVVDARPPGAGTRELVIRVVLGT